MIAGLRPRVGISRCLLGDEVRYDGGHKHDAALVAELAASVEWVGVCPELEIGMGVPREPIELVPDAAGTASGSRRVRMLGVTSRTDWTRPMAEFCRVRASELAGGALSGYVFKSRSPTCGLREHPDGPSRGLFAEALIRALPDLPVEEETALQDPERRARFLDRVMTYHRTRGR